MIHRLERPGMALAILAIALLGGLFTLHRFDDLDVCWHLRTGQWILDEGRIPRSDPFGTAAAGLPWIDFEWGAQAVAAAIVNGTGIVGLHLVVVTLVVVTLLCFSLKSARSPTVLVATLLFTLTAWQRFLVRPDILSFPLVLLAMALVDRIPQMRRSTPLLLALLTAVWANLHGSFVLVLMLV